jgi:hypothetical protein
MKDLNEMLEQFVTLPRAMSMPNLKYITAPFDDVDS